MKYMILIYGNLEGWKAMDADAFRRLMAAHEALQQELRASGEFVETNELPVRNAKVAVRIGRNTSPAPAILANRSTAPVRAVIVARAKNPLRTEVRGSPRANRADRTRNVRAPRMK